MSWRDEAACRGMNWFAFELTDAHRIQVCKRCPVIDECRLHARVAGEPVGVWGGETVEERGRFSSSSIPHPCAECGRMIRGRLTCSDECAEERRRRQNTDAARLRNVNQEKLSCPDCGHRMPAGEQCPSWECDRRRKVESRARLEAS